MTPTQPGFTWSQPAWDRQASVGAKAVARCPFVGSVDAITRKKLGPVKWNPGMVVP